MAAWAMHHRSSEFDLDLLRRYATSCDADAFRELTLRYSGIVFSTARRATGNAQDAEDIAQACFLQLARHAHEVRDCLGGWLHRTALRRAMNLRRDSQVRQRHESAAVPPLPEEDDVRFFYGMQFASTAPPWNDSRPC